MKFWDASGLVALLIEQPASDAMQRVFQADPEIAAWWGTPVECVSAIARLEREALLSEQGVQAARSRLEALADGWVEVQPTEPVRRAAQRLLRLHPLRAPDALQAAAATVLSENDPGSLEVVCLDGVLAAALRREGFRVLAPA